MRRCVLVVLVVTAACAGSPAADPTNPTIDADAAAPSSVSEVVTTTGDPTIDADAAAPSSVSEVVTTTGDPTIDAVAPIGFDLVAARVTEPDGTLCDVCLWLASTAEQRNRGLMGVTDLGPAAGMAFRYRAPHSTRFWMKDTPLALSIAFYGPDGAFMDSFDMEPCVTADCTRYPTPTDFLIAVETRRGELDELGMLAGSSLVLLDLPCEQGTADSG